MAIVQIETYERGPFGKLALGAFLTFEGIMVAGLLAYLSGAWDPIGPAVSVFNPRDPMGAMMASMKQAQMREGFMPGYLVVWAAGSVVLGLLALLTRRKVFISSER